MVLISRPNIASAGVRWICKYEGSNSKPLRMMWLLLESSLWHVLGYPRNARLGHWMVDGTAQL